VPQSKALLANAMKDNYGPGLRNAINNAHNVINEVSKNEQDIIGERAVWSLHSGRSASTSARAELAPLATADRQRYTRLFEDLSYNYHTIKVSGQAKHLTRGDSGAFVRALESELDGAEMDIMSDRARQSLGTFTTINGTPQTGVMGTVTGGTTTVPVLGGSTVSEMRYFFVNMIVDVVIPATGAVRGTKTIVAVDRNAKTITFDSPLAGTVATDVIVRTGNLNNEINGLRGLISATTVFAGVNPATVPEWASIEVGSSTTAISEVFLDELSESVATDGNGDMPSLYLTGYLQRRKLASMLQAQKRYEGREMTLTSGWKGLQIAQGSLVVDRFCPETVVFAISPKSLSRFVGLDFTWDEDDGKVLFKALDGSDAVEARFKVYDQLVVTTRNAHALGTLAVPSF